MTNCFVLTVPDAGENAKDCWIVDCGFEPEPMFQHIDREGRRPRQLLLTPVASLDEALALALPALPADGRIGIMPRASSTIPHVVTERVDAQRTS